MLGKSTQSSGKVNPVEGPRPHFTCATENCDKQPNARARAQIAHDLAFTNLCSDCYYKHREATVTAGHTMHTRVGGDNPALIVMMATTTTPTQETKDARKLAKKARQFAAP